MTMLKIQISKKQKKKMEDMKCEVSNIYDVSRKIYFIKNEGLTFTEVDDTDIVDRIVNKGPKEIVGKSKEFLEARL